MFNPTQYPRRRHRGRSSALEPSYRLFEGVGEAVGLALCLPWTFPSQPLSAFSFFGDVFELGVGEGAGVTLDRLSKGGWGGRCPVAVD